jgi:HAD superfamily phosphoserine phosphatase-like hydrolase
VSVADAAHALVQLLQTLGPPRPAAALEGALLAPPAGWVSPVTTNPWRYKVVAFDLDGTLLRGDDFVFSWERVWRALNVSPAVQNELRRAYRRKAGEDPSPRSRVAAYRQWCEKAVEHFRKRGLTRNRLSEIAAPLRLTHNCRETLQQLRQHGMVVGIISGGIDTFLLDRFPDYRDFVDFAFINQLKFADSGVVCDVDATAYDFEGKADALRVMCERAGCDESETVFVGDHFNDESVMLSAALSIAYPPHDQVSEGVATASIHEDDLSTLLPRILVA